MIPSMLTQLVVRPVGLKVPVAEERAELEDRFCAAHRPDGARHIEPVVDEVPTGALDGSGCDGESLVEVDVVAQEREMVGQVAGTVIDLLPLLRRASALCRAAANTASDLAGLPVQNAEGSLSDPLLG